MGLSKIADVIFAAWALLLIVKGLQRSDNWLGWFMFSRSRYFTVTLRDKRGDVNVWDYLPHCQVMLSKSQIEALIRFIQNDRHAGFLEGTVTMYLTEGSVRFIVRRSYLIPQEDEE
jgi:hypothetical protein